MKFSSVNIDAKVLEKQQEMKNSNTDFQSSKKATFDPKNYLDLKLKEDETHKTVKVRFLPISSTDGTVFFSINTHALKVDKEIAKSGFKSYVCLNDENVNSSEECPICRKSRELFEKAAEYRKIGNEMAAEAENLDKNGQHDLANIKRRESVEKNSLSKSLYKEACSLKKKRTYIVRVIDREHEDEGVKFWRFNDNTKGEGVYDKLFSLYKTRKLESIEDGDGEYSIFDLYDGKDIIINVTKSFMPDGFGGIKETVAYNITDSGNRKPLSKDVEMANLWLNDSKTWMDVYSLKNADYLDLVVNGKIPIFNKELGKFVEKDKSDSEND